MNKCETCKHWKILETTGSERGDTGMISQGYKNCDADGTKWRQFRFLHKNARACEKYNVKV